MFLTFSGHAMQQHTHTYLKILRKNRECNERFNISISKGVSIVTETGPNFVKSYKEVGVKVLNVILIKRLTRMKLITMSGKKIKVPSFNYTRMQI